MPGFSSHHVNTVLKFYAFVRIQITKTFKNISIYSYYVSEFSYQKIRSAFELNYDTWTN